MTPEAQRIAIAEACGWGTPPDCARTPPHEWWNPEDNCCYENPPDYLNDLNAMHEAEKTLNRNQWCEYVRQLSRGFDADEQEDIGFSIYLLTATAAQRAEAFLRTIGKWTEESK